MSTNQKNISRNKRIWFAGIVMAIVGSGLLLWALLPANPSSSKIIINSDNLNMTVYRTATCACCVDYVQYLRSNSNLEVSESIVQDLTPYRNENVSTNGLESCHIGHIGSYFIEGHVPLEVIKTLLESRPNIVGIALPEMPDGSPGMGGIKTAPFNIYALFANGTSTLYVTI